MITAPYLEIAVVVLGLAVLMLESFLVREDKRLLAWAGIAGLAAVFFASFFVVPAEPQPNVSGFWQFYTADLLALFFKRFSLLTTIIVLIMMIDYAPVLRRFMPQQAGQTGLGEFFALPIFTCGGLMSMASAIDFIMIFVSLELVTISFYVLVSFTRRNPDHARSRCQISRAECTLDRFSALRYYLDFRRHRGNQFATDWRGLRHR